MLGRAGCGGGRGLGGGGGIGAGLAGVGQPRQWVYLGAAAEASTGHYFEMQVRAGGFAVAADLGDLLSGTDLVAGVHEHPGFVHVSVDGAEGLAVQVVVDDYPLPEAGRGAGVDHGPVGGGVDRGAFGGGQVHAEMAAVPISAAGVEGVAEGVFAAADRPDLGGTRSGGRFPAAVGR